MKPTCLVLLLFLFPTFAPAQTSTDQDFRTQRGQMIRYNIGIGVLIGGVGALINKQTKEEWLPVLLKGMGQGALGGYVNFQAKNLIFNIAEKENIAYGWPSKFIHSLSASMLENAAANRNFWEAYHMNFGPIRLEIDKKKGYKPGLRLLPSALVGNIWIATKGKLDLNRSLKSGIPVFQAEGRIAFFGGTFDGFVISNATVLNKNQIDNYELFAHEYMHVLQYEDYIGITSFFNRPYEKWVKNSKLFRQTDSWIHYDFHMPVFSAGGLLMRNTGACYFNSWIEFEAEHFATRNGVFRCK